MNNPLFSILIPTWNNLPFLQCCVQSIRKNSTYSHQIIVHVNDGSDGTLQWVRQQGIDHTHTEHNVGVCLAMNMMRSKVKTHYMLFLNDDMYVLPQWDKVIYDEVRQMKDNRFFLSATTIQPHTPGRQIIKADYGDTLETFREQALLDEYQDYRMDDWPRCLPTSCTATSGTWWAATALNSRRACTATPTSPPNSTCAASRT